MIKSKHNVYPEFSDQVVERWQKSTVMAIGGKRLNPYRPDEKLDFLLMSRDEDFNLATRVLTFNYESEIVELYSDREVRLFRSLNKSAIERGLMKPYEELAPAVDTSNVLTDSDIADILNITNHLKLKSRLKQITALHVLTRIKAGITDNHKQWFAKLVEARRLELI
jgi:hypothetical protein